MQLKENKPNSNLLSNDTGLLIINEKGGIENVNNKVYELLGYADKSLIGNYFIPFIKEKNNYNYSNVEHDNYKKEFNPTIFNGENIEIEYIELTRTNTKNEKYYVGVIKDTSKKKTVYKKEIEYLKYTNEKVVEKLEEEKELSELKSRFVSMASHEFRTPLAGVLSSVQLIKRYLDAEIMDWKEFKHKRKIETHFDKIEKSVTNLNLILNDFLSLGKIEEDKISCGYTHFDLSRFLTNLCQELKPLCKPRQEIIYQHKGSQQKVYLDSHILRNIINNLISNSIKYSPENKKIRITSEVKEESVIIIVRDEGIGIPEAEHKNIFRRFFRAKNAINYQGTGLGLSIVRKYTELMEGSITFKSQENKGSYFLITFPIK